MIYIKFKLDSDLVTFTNSLILNRNSENSEQLAPRRGRPRRRGGVGAFVLARRRHALAESARRSYRQRKERDLDAVMALPAMEAAFSLGACLGPSITRPSPVIWAAATLGKAKPRRGGRPPAPSSGGRVRIDAYRRFGWFPDLRRALDIALSKAPMAWRSAEKPPASAPLTVRR